VRHAFNKFGGNLGADGSVGYMFKKVGLFQFPRGTDEDVVMEVAIEAGAEDVVTDSEGTLEVITEPGDFEIVGAALKAADQVAELAEITMRSELSTELDADGASSMLKMLEMLEDLDDVQNVYSNAEISDALLEELG